MTCVCTLLTIVLQQYALAPQGVHGVGHWARVLENGRRLAASTGADPHILECFAVLHDASRRDDGRDLEHGPRAARLAVSLRSTVLVMPNADFELLHYAIAHHTDGLTDADVTVQTCWDADRLDLYRVGILPDAAHLCTPVAQDAEVIAWAVRRSVDGRLPDLVRTEWGLTLPRV